MAASIPVQYRITDVRAWFYKQAEPAELLQFFATREVVRYLVNADVDDLLTSGRPGAAETLRQRIQARAEVGRAHV